MNRNKSDDNRVRSRAKYNKDYNRGVKHRNDGQDEFKRNKKSNNSEFLKFKPVNEAARNSANKRLQHYRQYLTENKIQHKHMLPSTDTAAKNNNNTSAGSKNQWGDDDSNKKTDGIQNRLIRTPHLPNKKAETAVTEEEFEEMDWEPLDESIILSEIQVIRQTMDPNESFKTLSSSLSFTTDTDYANNSTKNAYIVVDTNIFISSLHIIQEILNESNRNSLIILVPWMVNQELDYLKEKNSNRAVQRNAIKAIKFINNCLESKNPLLKGQNASDALKYKYSSGNADDNILFCCLQVKERGNHVALLTNDLNLKNKALINDVPACNKDEILQHLRHGDSPAQAAIKNKIAEAKQQLGYLFSYITIKEMMSAYGETWQIVTKIDTSSPLSFEDCLKLIEKYWVPVFSIHLQKQCLKTVQEIRKILSEGTRITRDDFIKFRELVMGLCVYFRNAYNSYCASIEKCAKSVEETCQNV